MKNITITIRVKQPWEVSKGHAQHRSGAGVMGDRRTKRNRTRGAQKRKLYKEFE